MDLFRPLYKAHKQPGPPSEWFDCKRPERRVGSYTIDEVERKYDLVNAYKAYDLKEPLNVKTFAVKELPGFYIISGLVSCELQRILCQEATNDYLYDPRHKTNLDAHYKVDRPIKLWTKDDSNNPEKPSRPKKPNNSQNLNDPSFLRRKLRWVTLGGQYNWTLKEYPTFEIGSQECPLFPKKLAAFVKSAFSIEAQAAIVNFYGPHDTLSPHQDVAELCQQDLASVSLGCECVFYVCKERLDTAPLSLLLRSGDVVVLSGESRSAFHGVGRIYAQTSPQHLLESSNEDYNKWLETHRINLNVRQMVDRSPS